MHFEDLEPHRFEDLIRQLIYDFREWHRLEATGRQGSEEGFDIRGWEIFATSSSENSDDEEEKSIDEDNRIWLIQCKREKTITPKQLVGYLKTIKVDPREPLYGVIFVAACDFSKKSHDAFREWCVGRAISEFYLWGRGELEDLLFQPRYDHLLFAYFGISLQIRKRSMKTKLRGLLSIKRQAFKYLRNHQPVLLRDPEASEYPFKGEIKDFDKHPKWRIFEFLDHYYSGLKFLSRYFAYVDDDGVKWDYEKRTKMQPDDPWAKEEDKNLEWKVRQHWSKLPDRNRGTLEIEGHVPYEEIIAIDEKGDECFRHPHIYVRFDPSPFKGGVEGIVVTYDPARRVVCHAKGEKDENRITFFPDTYPEIQEEGEKN